MVMSAPTQDEIAQVVRQWTKDLPKGTATLKEEQLEIERVMKLTPSNPNGCSIEFRISQYGTFGLYFGAGFAFEEITSSINLVIDICNSIRQAKIVEDVWEWKGKLIKTKGVLTLGVHPDLYDQGSTSWFGFWKIGKKRRITYATWD